MLQLIKIPIATVNSLTTSPKCIGSATAFSRSVSAGTFRSAATWKSTNSMPASRLSSAEDRGWRRTGLCAALADAPAQRCFARHSRRSWTERLRRHPTRSGKASRFGVDLCTREVKTAGSIARATYELFAGMIEFGLMRRLTDIVTVTDARMERIFVVRAGLCDVSAHRGRSEKRSRSRATSRCLASGFGASGSRASGRCRD